MDEYSATTLATQYSRGTVIAAVVIAALWHVVYDLTAEVTSWSIYRWPVLSLAGWAGYSLAVAVCSWQLLRGPGAVRRPGLMAAVALACGVAVGIACQGAVMRYPGWAFGSIMWVAILAFWGRRLHWLLGFFVANTLINGALMVTFGDHDRASIARFLVATFGAGAIQLGFASGARALTLAATWAVDAAAKKSQEEGERRAADEVHRSRHERYLALGKIAAPALARLAAGAADPADPALQRSCAAAASRLRRLIAETDDLPDPLLHELRACADVAERRGVIIDLVPVGSTPDMPVEVRRALSELPIEVLAATRSFARITLAATEEYVAVSIVADADPDIDLDPVSGESSAGVCVEISRHREGDQLWAHTQWHHPSPLL
jgi:hypothetical protein